jgi:hypothetical protein
VLPPWNDVMVGRGAGMISGGEACCTGTVGIAKIDGHQVLQIGNGRIDQDGLMEVSKFRHHANSLLPNASASGNGFTVPVVSWSRRANQRHGSCPAPASTLATAPGFSQ